VDPPKNKNIKTKREFVSVIPTMIAIINYRQDIITDLFCIWADILDDY
jgi:hypothetical protein